MGDSPRFVPMTSNMPNGFRGFQTRTSPSASPSSWRTPRSTRTPSVTAIRAPSTPPRPPFHAPDPSGHGTTCSGAVPSRNRYTASASRPLLAIRDESTLTPLRIGRYRGAPGGTPAGSAHIQCAFARGCRRSEPLARGDTSDLSGQRSKIVIMDPRDRARLIELDAQDQALPANLADPSERRRNRALRQQIEAEQQAIQVRLRAALASARGWSVAKTLFTFESLTTGRSRRSEIMTTGELIDHPECFRERNRPIALLTHSFTTDREPFVALARESGLAVEFLDWSWYFPERCLAALFIRI